MQRSSDVEGSVCEALLDMLEETPFGKVTVTALAKRADVSRSAFYAHFDSIYGVAQKIEDDFIAGLDAAEDPSREELLERGQYALPLDKSGYLRRNLRVFRLLVGENGEPSFRYRVGNHVKQMTERLLDSAHIALEATERQLLVNYITGGQLAAVRWLATHEDEAGTEKAAGSFARDVLAKGWNTLVEAGVLPVEAS